jgi:sigma-B regulation protein RsbU (phosphoserine phosphatase)
VAAVLLQRGMLMMGGNCRRGKCRPVTLVATPARGGSAMQNAVMLDPNSSDFLAHIGEEMATADRPDMALEHTLETIRRSLGAEAASIFLFNEAEDLLECKASLGPNPATGMTVPRGVGIIGQVAEQGRPVLVEDVASYPGFYRAIDKQTGFVTRSVVCAPLIAQAKVLGTVMLLNKSDDRRFSGQDQALLMGYCALAGLSIKNARLSILALERERIQRELEIAREIQRSMLPSASHSHIQGANRAARIVSGDFYSHQANPDGDAWFCLGDVSGKGINAALWMVRAVSMFSCLAQTQGSPARLLEALNRELRVSALRGMFITMVVGCIDKSGCHARLANAGHLPVLIWRQGEITEIPASGPPIGILDAVVYDDVSTGPGPATLCMVSDGAVEAIEGKTFANLDRLKGRITTMIDAGQLSAEALIADLISRAEAPDDDATALTVQLLAPPPGEEPQAAPRLLFSTCFAATPGQLKPMRDAVLAAVQAQGVDAELASNFVLALNEACMNVIQHAKSGSAGMQINVELFRQDGTLILHVLDNAAPVDVSTVEPRHLDDVRPGGLGVHFMREIMDQVEFLPPPAGFGNFLRMRKTIRADPSVP